MDQETAKLLINIFLWLFGGVSAVGATALGWALSRIYNDVRRDVRRLEDELVSYSNSLEQDHKKSSQKLDHIQTSLSDIQIQVNENTMTLNHLTKDYAFRPEQSQNPPRQQARDKKDPDDGP